MQKQLEYVLEENRVLIEVIGKKRIPLTDAQRRRLAIKGRTLAPKDRATVCRIVKPETLLGWFRKLVAAKYDGSKNRRPARRRTRAETRELVLRFANENLTWGYTRIRDALSGIGVTIGRTTVADILREAGIDPAPRRRSGMDWKTFLKAHWDTLYGCDFFTVEVLGLFGPVRYMVLFVIEVKTRRVEIAGIHVNPDGQWMKQVARNLTDCFDGFLHDATHLIHDRDPLFTCEFRSLLRGR